MAFPFQAFSGISGSDSPEPRPVIPTTHSGADPIAESEPRTLRLGDLLVERGLLSVEQRDAVLEAQRTHPRPFGLLAEQMFGVCPRDVEQAWAQQYASLAHWEDPSRDPSDEEALALVDRRQAWQFAVVPLRSERGEVVIATTAKHLARAMRFAGWRIAIPHRFVLCGQPELESALARHYPMGRIDPQRLRSEAAVLAKSA